MPYGSPYNCFHLSLTRLLTRPPPSPSPSPSPPSPPPLLPKKHKSLPRRAVAPEAPLRDVSAPPSLGQRGGVAQVEGLTTLRPQGPGLRTYGTRAGRQGQQLSEALQVRARKTIDGFLQANVPGASCKQLCAVKWAQ